jgi:hypothetical protein
LNLQNSFEDSKEQFPFSYWLIYFSDLHRTLLKSGSQLLAAFQKSLVEIWEMYKPIGRKELNFKRE